MDALTCIQTRRSQAQLTSPAPDSPTLEKILKVALNAPDHGLLRPWRITVLTENGLIKLGDLMAAIHQRQANAKGLKLTTEQLEHTRSRPQRAPMILVVGCKVTLEHKIPVVEQQLATGALTQNLQLAFHAAGFGCIWRTGEWSYHAEIKQAFGLEEHDLLTGFLYVGTPATPCKPRTEFKFSDYVQFWS